MTGDKWKRRIVAAIKRGGFTRKDKLLIGSFRTCMIGERFDLYGYSENTVYCVGMLKKIPDPEEYEKNYHLGMNGFTAVHMDRIRAAIKIFNRIFPANKINYREEKRKANESLRSAQVKSETRGRRIPRSKGAAL